MDFETYQIESRKTAQYPDVGKNYIYPTLGLIGEFGELTEKIKKIIRDDNGTIKEEKRIAIIRECGDCLWYASNLCTELSIKLGVCADIIIENTLEELIFSMYGYMSKAIYDININRIQNNQNKPINTARIHRNLCIFNFFMIKFLQKFSISIEEVMQINIDKLADRKRRGVIGGSGDNR